MVEELSPLTSRNLKLAFFGVSGYTLSGNMMAEGSLKIFLSYRREDCGGHAPALVGRIYDRLSAHYGESNVFMDVDAIPPGVDFTEHIDQAVEQTNVLLAVVGPEWVSLIHERSQQANDFVRIEVESALKRSIPVIPLLVGNTPMPEESELPESLKRFATRSRSIPVAISTVTCRA